MSPVSVSPQPAKPKADHEILNQNWFKSVGPRTYAAQLKKAGNGNHFLVLTEGRRDEKTGEIRKNRIFIFSEDFSAFFKMLHETAVFIREHPVPDAIARRQEKMWAKRRGQGSDSQSNNRRPQERTAGSGPDTRSPNRGYRPNGVAAPT